MYFSDFVTGRNSFFGESFYFLFCGLDGSELWVRLLSLSSSRPISLQAVLIFSSFSFSIAFRTSISFFFSRHSSQKPYSLRFIWRSCCPSIVGMPIFRSSQFALSSGNNKSIPIRCFSGIWSWQLSQLLTCCLVFSPSFILYSSWEIFFSNK